MCIFILIIIQRDACRSSTSAVSTPMSQKSSIEDGGTRSRSSLWRASEDTRWRRSSKRGLSCGSTVSFLRFEAAVYTRYPVADRWYLNEELGSLRDTLLRALLRFGPPKVVYTDRGAVYRAEQLAY